MNLVNGPSLKASDLLTDDLGRAMLREIELVCAVAELECLRTGKSLSNDQLNLRIGDILVGMDDEVDFACAGVFDVESATCEAAKSIADTLAMAPRGTYAVLRTMAGGYDGIPKRPGYDAWMSDGKGHLATHSGHKFMGQNRNAFRIGERSLYSQIWSMVSYYARDEARRAITEETARTNAERFLGQKIKGDVYMGRTSWTSFTLEEILPDEQRYAVKVSKRGASRRYKIDDVALCHSLPVVYTMPERYMDDGNEARRLSLPERRIQAVKDAFAQHCEDTGLVANTPLYDESFRVDGDRYSYDLKRTVSYTPYTADSVGTLIVEFAANSATIACLDVQSPPSRIAA